MIEARRDDVVDDFFGTVVADPYRWLENPADPETQAWSEAQSHAAATYLQALPARGAIHRRLTALWDFPRQSAPMKHGDRFFFFKNDGLQNQAALYATDDPTHDPVLVLDPNRLSADGTVALTTAEFSHDGAFLAYGTSHSGSDWQEVRVREVASGEDGRDLLRWCKFSSIAWKHDSSGFFYNRFPEPGTVLPEDAYAHNRVYWHARGTEQDGDVLIYERPDMKEVRFSPIITEDGAYLLLYGAVGTETKNRLYYRHVESDGPFVRLLDSADANYTPIEMIGSILYLKTDLNAPRGRIIAIDLAHPERAEWRDIVPEGEDTIAFAAMSNRQFIVVPMHDASHRGSPALSMQSNRCIGSCSNDSGARNQYVHVHHFARALRSLWQPRNGSLGIIESAGEPLYRDEVRTVRFQFLTGGRHDAVTDGEESDHRADPDDDTQHRQGCPHHVCTETL